MFRPLLVTPSSGWIPSPKKYTIMLYNHLNQRLYSIIVYFLRMGMQPEDGLTRRGRNMYLAEKFVYTLTPCILQVELCF